MLKNIHQNSFQTSVILCSGHPLFFVPNIAHFLFRTSVILCSEHPVYFLSEHLDGFHSELPEKRFYVLYPLPDTRSNSRMFGRARTKKDKPDNCGLHFFRKSLAFNPQPKYGHVSQRKIQEKSYYSSSPDMQHELLNKSHSCHIFMCIHVGVHREI